MRNKFGRFVKGNQEGFQKGHPCFLKHHSKETKKKLSITHKGKKLSEQHKKNLSISHKGLLTGFNHPNYKGGKYKHHEGYIYILKPGHPFANCQGYIFEHRIVVEKYLGRPLKPKEVTHHINNIRSDNRPENLMAFTNKASHSNFHRGFNVNPKYIIFDGREFHKINS